MGMYSGTLFAAYKTRHGVYSVLHKYDCALGSPQGDAVRKKSSLHILFNSLNPEHTAEVAGRALYSTSGRMDHTVFGKAGQALE